MHSPARLMTFTGVGLAMVSIAYLFPSVEIAETVQFQVHESAFFVAAYG
jgi:hypothetical protein